MSIRPGAASATYALPPPFVDVRTGIIDVVRLVLLLLLYLHSPSRIRRQRADA
jgi:hypothetical protein